MTEQEKTEILDELEARFEKKYKGCVRSVMLQYIQMKKHPKGCKVRKMDS